MGRLIDVDGLKETIIKSYGPQATADGILLSSVMLALELLEAAPTVEAEPVRHGKLVDKMYYEYYADWANCTLCGGTNRADAKYCQRCGAKMDLEESVHEQI